IHRVAQDFGSGLPRCSRPLCASTSARKNFNPSRLSLLRPARCESHRRASATPSSQQRTPAPSKSAIGYRYARFLPVQEHPPSWSRSADQALRKSPVPRKTACAFALQLARLNKSWCTGEDSNLRSSEERQIYSLLPLTTRSPVHLAEPWLCRGSIAGKRDAFANHGQKRIGRHANILPHHSPFGA